MSLNMDRDMWLFPVCGDFPAFIYRGTMRSRFKYIPKYSARILSTKNSQRRLARSLSQWKGTSLTFCTETLFAHLAPRDEKGRADMFSIHETFEKLGADKLKPVYEHHEGLYSYDTLRLARLLFNKDK